MVRDRRSDRGQDPGWAAPSQHGVPRARHRFDGSGPPILFETMIFGSDLDRYFKDSYCMRYSTWDEAEVGHQRAIEEAHRQQAKIDEKLRTEVIAMFPYKLEPGTDE